MRQVDFLGANPQHPGWNIKGDAGWGSEPDSAEIFVDIQLDPTINPKKMRPELISDLTHELWNVIAHEAHHLTQDEGPLQRPSCPVPLPQESSSYFHYFVSGCEVPAFLIGFRSEAKSRGVPIETLMDAYLQNHVDVDHLKQADVKKIRSSWLAHNKWLKA